MNQTTVKYIFLWILKNNKNKNNREFTFTFYYKKYEEYRKYKIQIIKIIHIEYTIMVYLSKTVLGLFASYVCERKKASFYNFF